LRAGYRTLHLTEPRMNRYDKTLNPKVGFAENLREHDRVKQYY
jgi:hypothetical protein